MHEEIDFVLTVELERASKLRRPLSALVLLRPDLAATPLTTDLLHEAGVALSRTTRTYDAAGLITDRVILVVLPETGPDGVRVVSKRIRDELAAMNEGKRCWSVLEFTNVEQFGSAERLLEAARRVGQGAARSVA